MLLSFTFVSLISGKDKGKGNEWKKKENKVKESKKMETKNREEDQKNCRERKTKTTTMWQRNKI